MKEVTVIRIHAADHVILDLYRAWLAEREFRRVSMAEAVHSLLITVAENLAAEVANEV